MNYQGHDFVEFMKHTASRSSNSIFASSGYITSIDPENYTAKVMLQPYGIETGWVQIGSTYVGNDFGLVALPEISTEVTVIFELGDINSGKIICLNFNQQDSSPEVQPGQVILKHKSGSILKFNSDGSIELSANAVLKLSGGGKGVARNGDKVTVNVPGIGECQGTIISGSDKVESG